LTASNRITIYDVAERAAVSVATASKALNDTGRMAAETRERVKRIATDLGFRPNVLARNLSSRHSRSVGLLTDDTYGRFTLPVMAGVSAALIDHGVSVLLCALGDDPVMGRAYVETLLDKQVDGIIATGKRLDRPLAIDAAQLPLPTVYAFALGPPEALSFVPDERQGAALAVRHLIAQGRRRIAHITGPESFHVVGERAGAFRAMVGEAGLAANDALVLPGAWTESWGHEAVARLFNRAEAPDAIFCGNDQIARGVIDALRERGLGVPSDVSVIGFDNWEIVAEQARPPLTSIDMNLKELGRQAGAALLRLINGEAAERGVVKLPCSLVLRNS